MGTHAVKKIQNYEWYIFKKLSEIYNLNYSCLVLKIFQNSAEYKKYF